MDPFEVRPHPPSPLTPVALPARLVRAAAQATGEARRLREALSAAEQAGKEAADQAHQVSSAATGWGGEGWGGGEEVDASGDGM